MFECSQASDHALTSGGYSNLRMPHSRWNDIPEKDLTDCGYQVLLRSDEAGVDAFARQGQSLFVYFQGHPEYEANTLLLEYRREVGRYLKRERDTYPATPSGYFDADTRYELTALQHPLSRNGATLADFPTSAIEKKTTNTWQSVGARVYSNWLACLCGATNNSFQSDAHLDQYANRCNPLESEQTIPL